VWTSAAARIGATHFFPSERKTPSTRETTLMGKRAVDCQDESLVIFQTIIKTIKKTEVVLDKVIEDNIVFIIYE
jgi:hypothetical protein